MVVLAGLWFCMRGRLRERRCAARCYSGFCRKGFYLYRALFFDIVVCRVYNF